MALNLDRLQFFIKRVANSSMETFGSAVSQLYQHLYSEVKDNPIFDKYDGETKVWDKWIDESANRHWFLPANFEETKFLTFSIYKKIADKKEEGYNIAWSLISRNNVNDSIYELNSIFLEYLTKALEDIARANPEIETEEITPVVGNTVFIIHGHDELIKAQVQLLLLKAGVRNIVLHEQADKGRTIIDKLIEEGKSSNYAIALLSPDDIIEGGEKRARQNVILEIGYFMGKLGKERVRMLVKDDLQIPSDLSGILYEKYDSNGAWRMRILKELNAVGIYVDINAALGHL